MAWSIYYNGEPVAGDISLEAMEAMSDQVLELLQQNRPIWYDFQFPRGEGIGFHRLLLHPGVAVSFHEEGPDGQFPSAGRLRGF